MDNLACSSAAHRGVSSDLGRRVCPDRVFESKNLWLKGSTPREQDSRGPVHFDVDR